MMVVLAIIGVLTSLALVYAGERRANLNGLGSQLVGGFDAARLRAIASQRWQRARYDDDTRRLIFEQATTAGMEEPDDWSQVEVLGISRPLELAAIATTANVATGVDVPDEGDGLDEELRFAPDGSAVPRTVYLSAGDGQSRLRVVIYRVTGTAVVKEQW